MSPVKGEGSPDQVDQRSRHSDNLLNAFPCEIGGRLENLRTIGGHLGTLGALEEAG